MKEPLPMWAARPPFGGFAVWMRRGRRRMAKGLGRPQFSVHSAYSPRRIFREA